MIDTLQYIVDKFGLDKTQPKIDIRLSRHGGLTKLFRELDFKEIAEIGVEQGKYSQEICRDNPQAHLYSIDSWKAYSRYDKPMHQERLDKCYLETIERLKPYNCTIIKKYSMEAVKDFKPGDLDAVYLDGDHSFEFMVNDTIQWTKIVRPGGIVAGHDYKPEGQETTPIPFHVIQAVNAYVDAYKIRPLFILRGDRCPSWMFVRP